MRQKLSVAVIAICLMAVAATFIVTWASPCDDSAECIAAIVDTCRLIGSKWKVVEIGSAGTCGGSCANGVTVTVVCVSGS